MRRVLAQASFEQAPSLSLTLSAIWALLDRGPGVSAPVTDGCLTLIVLGWCGWACSSRRPRLRLFALVVLAAGGGVLAVVSAQGPGSAVGAVALVISTNQRRPESSLVVLAAGVLAVVAATVAVGAPATTWAGVVATFCGGWLVGAVRRSYRLRAEEAEHALAQERRAVAAEKHAAALEERARIAREIHDILAHSLSALSVNLSAAEGFLTDGESPTAAELAKARQCVRRAGGLAREGMAETREAVLALREDPRPLHEMLAELAETHAGAERVSLEVGGAPVSLSPEAGLVAFRTAQEALTNVRKHAPGAAVTIRLDYDPLDLTISSTLPPAGTERPLADQGAGFGLTGLAERAALVAGTLHVGEDHDTWRVHLRIPD